MPTPKFGTGQTMNPLDQPALSSAIHRLGQRGEELLTQTVGRTKDLVIALLRLIRRRPLEDWEMALVGRATRLMFEDRHLMDSSQEIRRAGTLADMLTFLTNGGEALQALTADSSKEEYDQTVRPLIRSFQALMDGPTGRIFSGPTSIPFDAEAGGLCVDISSIQDQGEETMAAVMVSMWAECFGAVEAGNALADAHLIEQHHHTIVMDEMWRPMRVEGAGLVDKLDALTRLNRYDGVCNIYVSHTPKDQRSMSSEADAFKALGFTERSGMLGIMGLSRADLETISEVVHLSEEEINQVSQWNTPPGWKVRYTVGADGRRRPSPPPGAGKILLKIGERPGLGVRVVATQAELDLHDTNERWVENYQGKD
ncbi:MAG: hypothetical protein L0L18_12320 [Acidipropionibacterium jensenii]|nr:hypothetical protein [Acidipropionibacterium jensenii]